MPQKVGFCRVQKRTGSIVFNNVSPLNIPGQIRDFQIIQYNEKTILTTSINNDILNFMKSNNLKQLSLLLLLFLTVFTACQSDYTKLVNKEINSGIVYDSVLFGLKFGDSKELNFLSAVWS